MSEQLTIEWTGTFWWSFEKATEISNLISKGEIVNNNPTNYEYLKGQYMTAIKGEPHYPDTPEECWAITNKYDPRIIAKNK